MHTPGPWELVEGPPAAIRDKIKGCITSAPGGTVFSRTEDGGALEIACYTLNMENARLIAAAPELLRELQEMVEFFGGYQGLKMMRAKEVIAKATGQSL